MALQWIEGFEGFGGTTFGNNLASDLVEKYPTTSGLDGQDTLQAGRTGGFAYRASFTTHLIQTPVFTPQSNWVVGIGFKPGGFGGPFEMLASRSAGGTVDELRLEVGPSGDLQIFRGTTFVEASAASILTVGIWHYIEWKFFLDNVSGSYKVKVDGVTVLNTAGVDTVNVNSTADAFRLKGSSGNFIASDYDDWYILDNTGPAPTNDFLGDSKIVPMFSNGAGDSTGWTVSGSPSNFSAVNEDLIDDDVTHVEASVVSNKDLYNYDNPTGLGATVFGVQLNTHMRTTDANNFNVSQVAKSVATEVDQSTQLVASTSYKNFFNIIENDPATGVPWLQAGLDGAQFGLKIQP